MHIYQLKRYLLTGAETTSRQFIITIVEIKMDNYEELERLNPDDISLNIISNEPFFYLLPFGHIIPDEVESIYDQSDEPNLNAMAAPARLYPNGGGNVTVSVTVTDQNGNPVPGVNVTFRVEAIRPSGAGWRTEDGVVARYGSASRAKARRRIQNGQIRLIGTLSRNNATTNAQGQAETLYTVSHIGGNQSQIAEEHVTSTIPNGSSTSIIQIGYDWMASIPTVNGGLRIVGATGTHIHRDLVQRLRDLGNAVAQANWPHPVTITAGNLRWGGLYPPHFTHQWGAEVDMRPMTTDGNAGRWQDANYDRPRTQAMVSALAQLGAGTIYFNDPQITGATPLGGHDNHLHASFAANAVEAFALKDYMQSLTGNDLTQYIEKSA